MEAKVAFDSVCEKIAEKYIKSGWKYVKSKHWMSKKDKNFTYKIKFHTSWYNISEKSVELYAVFSVSFNKTKESFTANATTDSGIPQGKLSWNVATEDTWDDTIDEVTEWIDTLCMPIVEELTSNLDLYVEKVVKEGFYPSHGYYINIEFVLQYGSREMAEEATKRYYDSLEDYEKVKFKRNYESMINGGDAVDKYGEHMMLNPSEFRTVIENKIIVNLD